MIFSTKFRQSLALGIFTTACLLPTAHAGTQLDLSFSSDTIKFGAYQKGDSGDKLQNYGVDYLYTSKRGGMLSGVGEIVRAGFESAPNFDAGLTGKVFYLNTDSTTNKTGYGIMIGAIARYWLPTEVPVSVGASYLMGPNILTAGDIDSNTELNLKVSVEVTPGTSAYIGYRKQQFTFKKSSGTFTLDDAYNLGVSFTFN